jgi:aspartyl-tRNA(Asn)/glutamyl-tRNA(Gln) amidotransferase subunit A
MFNLGGQPAMAIPCGFDPDGLPISVQLAARPHADAMVLGVARAYQQVTDWHLQRPPGLP